MAFLSPLTIPYSYIYIFTPNGHRTPASTDAAVQGTPRPTVPTTSTRTKVLPRGVRVLLDEAVGFLESTRGEITLTTASQPLPSSRSLPRGPHRIPSSQITTHCVNPSTRVTRKARSRLNQFCSFKHCSRINYCPCVTL